VQETLFWGVGAGDNVGGSVGRTIGGDHGHR